MGSIISRKHRPAIRLGHPGRFLFTEAYWRDSRFFCLSDEFEYLLNVLFSKRNSGIIDQDARNAHDIILLLHVFEMVNIVYLCRDILVFCRNMLRRYYSIGTHRAGQRYEHLNIGRLAYRLNSFSYFIIHWLSRSHRIIDTQNEGRKFMSARNSVKSKPRFGSVGAAYLYAWCKIRGSIDIRHINRQLIRK